MSFQGRIVPLWLRQLHLVLRAVNRGRVYGLVYTTDNTAEEALAGLRFVIVKLYATSLEMLVRLGELTEEVPEFRIQAEEMRAIGTFRTLSEQLEKAARNCGSKMTQTIDPESTRLLRVTPQFREGDVSALSQNKDNEGRDDKVGDEEGRDDEAEDEENRLARLDWISDLAYDEHHWRVREGRMPGICEWLMQHSDFGSWETIDVHSVLWLEGSCKLAYQVCCHGLVLTLIVGTGKTFLMSQVVDHIQEGLANSPRPRGLAFFYCGELRAADRQTHVALLRSLIRQLTPSASRGSREVAESMGYRDEDVFNDPGPGLTAEMCKGGLLNAVGLYHKTFLVLDGLEELTPAALQSFTETLAFLLRLSPGSLKIFISSRDSSIIRQFFISLTAITLYHINLPHWAIKDLDESLTSERDYPHTYFNIKRFVQTNLGDTLSDRLARIVRESEGV